MQNVFIVFTSLFLMAAGLCFGQVSSVYGNLRISVVDGMGAQVPGASIEVKMPERNWSRTVTAGGESAYLPALPPGEYTVAVTAVGFDAQQSTVKILLGHEAALRFVLRPGTHREEITVSAAASEVDSYTIPIHTFGARQN